MMMTAPLLLSFVLASPQLPAETAPPRHTGVRALLSALGDDVKHLPTKENLVIASVGGGLALGARPLDQTVNARAIGQSDRVTSIFAVGRIFGDTPEQVAFSIGAWALGRVTDKPRVSHMGMDLLRAQAVTELLVEPLKFATHRQRPDGSNYQSFPSGHAAATFAAAAVFQRHLGWKRSLGAYAVATFVAAARLQENRHYLSDVVFGAAVGTIAGRTVTRHGRENWTLVPIPAPGGVAIGVTKIFDAAGIP